MRTSELPAMTVVKFKNEARLHLFYERVPDHDWSTHDVGSLKTIDIRTNDIMTILKTSVKEDHVGQTVFLDGRARVLYYQRDTFFDRNQGVVAGVDITAKDYYYDVIS